MKIIKLTMNAFSTYHQKTVIDFEEMIDHGIYLISGPTGSGKTTIFDAITFALYGSASGSERQASHFRSDFASPDEETYVELVFEIHNQIYTIKRSPTYNRVGFKTAKPANAFLTFNNVTIEGLKEVNMKVNELLGVDEKQFKQIVMIAQGEFTKLIYASSEDREKVLRHIFHSTPLLKFEELLKEKTKAYKEQYTLSLQTLISQFKLLSFPEEFFKIHKDGFHPSYIEDSYAYNNTLLIQHNELNNQYISLKDDYNKKSEEYNVLFQRNESINRLKEVENKYNLILKQDEDMKKCLYDIEKLKVIQSNADMLYNYNHLDIELNKNKSAYQNALKKNEVLEESFKDIQVEYNTLDILSQQKNDCIVDITKTKELIKQKEDYITKTEEYQRYESEISELLKQEEAVKNEYESLKKRMERDADNVNSLPVLEIELSNMETQVAESNNRKIAIHELSDLYDQLQHLTDEHYDHSGVYKKKADYYLELSTKYQYEDEKFKRGQAGILASTLKDNEPCPVCGSLHHPSPAPINDDVLSSMDLDGLYKKVEEAKKEKEDAYQDVLLLNQRQSELMTRIDVYKQQLHIEDELSKEVFIRVLSEVIQVTNKLTKKYDKLNTEIVYLKKVHRSLEKSKADLLKLENHLTSIENKIHEKEKRMSILMSQIESLSIIDNKKDYHHELTNKQKELQDLEKKIEKIQNNYHRISKDLSLSKHTIEQLVELIKDLSSQYQTVKTDIETFIKESFKDHEEFEYYKSNMSLLNSKEKIYRDYHIQKKSLEDQLNSLKLYKDLNIIDLSAYKQSLNEKEVEMNAIYKQVNEKYLLYTKNNELIKTLETVYKKNQDIFNSYTLYADLADYTSGKNPQRLSFERYVLSSYFETILEFANIELLKMSQGRYALYRKTSIKGAKQQGLDLSVMDYETGVMRDIQSLSGGESFKAALSLALGLSSMIQSYAGGIELNTLFIDEGFGSLDSESIDKALKVLLDLRNDNKVIGIISHVSDLKERISTQIIVEKGKKGSYLHIEKD